MRSSSTHRMGLVTVVYDYNEGRAHTKHHAIRSMMQPQDTQKFLLEEDLFWQTVPVCSSQLAHTPTAECTSTHTVGISKREGGITQNVLDGSTRTQSFAVHKRRCGAIYGKKYLDRMARRSCAAEPVSRPSALRSAMQPHRGPNHLSGYSRYARGVHKSIRINSKTRHVRNLKGQDGGELISDNSSTSDRQDSNGTKDIDDEKRRLFESAISL